MFSRIDYEFTPLSGRILVVEDDPTCALIWSSFFKMCRISYSIAHDGYEAVEFIKSGSSFDVIFMDLMMPVMDGFSATKAIRAWEVENSTKPNLIFAQSADVFTTTQHEAISSGMNGFFTKPINFDEIHLFLAHQLS